MKFHFEADLDFQIQAIEAVCDLFRGQEVNRTEFTLTSQSNTTLDSEDPNAHNHEAFGNKQGELGIFESELGIGNLLSLPDEEILKNLKDIQLRNGLPPSDTLNSGDFTVEMETGTGKTYVYLRTIFELNKRYGFTKFVIVVPSIAIKEGVYKTLQITSDHFKMLYSGTPFEYFLYDSTKLGKVRNFATSSQIQIMVVTVGAINKKDINNLYKDSEKTGGEKPIDFIQATNPVLIVDEPQSVDGGLRGRGKEALGAMNPLCTLRYSATHIDKYHMVYRLDAIDAYEKRLVKQIEVASAVVENVYNRPYVKLLSVHNKGGTISAKVELDVQLRSGVKRQEVSVQDGDDLKQITEREIYTDYRIGVIKVQKGNEYMELQKPSGESFLEIGEAVNDIDVSEIRRQMIHRTIKEHFDKEIDLRPKGIKVLTLFFIDKVAKYRKYDPDGNQLKGEYAQIFEEEYRKIAKRPDYKTLLDGVDLEYSVEEIHDGYFSIDKKRRWIDTDENNQTNRENAERAYKLIMKDKEKLLSFGSPLKFIFSHSALREGWDNPNVFQICTLRDIHTNLERRQTIGRGLRLCVNQEGQRLHGFEVNTLTVIATESYQAFAENLQREIEKDTGVRFGIVEKHAFATIIITDKEGAAKPLGSDQSEVLWEHLVSEGHIDSKGKIKDSLRQSLREGSLTVPKSFGGQLEQITNILRKNAGRLDIKDADERRRVRTNQKMLQSKQFSELWKRIKYKTSYRVKFDSEILIKSCSKGLKEAPAIPKAQLQWRKADVSIGKAGVEATEKRNEAETKRLTQSDIELPDILTELEKRTQLTRRTIYRILFYSNRLEDFKTNPQKFIELVAGVINRCKELTIVDGIKYQRLGNEHYYAQEMFLQDELNGYLKNLIDVDKSVYKQVIWDSKVEADFVNQLENESAIKVYTKLPRWFTVPTPLGNYNPDWAVLVEQEKVERLYFIVETKDGIGNLRPTEEAKIKCGKKHFKALKTDAKFLVAEEFDAFRNEWLL